MDILQLKLFIAGISAKTTTHTVFILSQYLCYIPGSCTSPFGSPPVHVLAATSQNNSRLMSLLSTRIAAVCLFVVSTTPTRCRLDEVMPSSNPQLHFRDVLRSIGGSGGGGQQGGYVTAQAIEFDFFMILRGNFTIHL